MNAPPPENAWVTDAPAGRPRFVAAEPSPKSQLMVRASGYWLTSAESVMKRGLSGETSEVSCGAERAVTPGTTAEHPSDDMPAVRPASNKNATQPARLIIKVSSVEEGPRVCGQTLCQSALYSG